MKTITIHFYECEHEGDLDNYLQDVQDSGGKAVNYNLNSDAETCDVDVEVENVEDFLLKFKLTDACDFSQYQHN